MLTAAEIAAYAAQGFVVPAMRIDATRIGALRSTLDRLIAANPQIRPERLVSAHIEGENTEGVKGSADFLALARDLDLVASVAQLIGPDVVLWGCQIFCKPGGDGMEVPWHQDGHYWPIRPLATCTVWIALDDSTVENGCLRLIPGSHRERRLLAHMTEDRADVVLNQRADEAGFDAATAVDIELSPGQMSLHDVYAIHGSNPNRSPKRRAGVAIRYMPATSLFARDLIATGAAAGYKVDFARRPIWLVSGQDRTGKNDFTIGHKN